MLCCSHCGGSPLQPGTAVDTAPNPALSSRPCWPTSAPPRCGRRLIWSCSAPWAKVPPTLRHSLRGAPRRSGACAFFAISDHHRVACQAGWHLQPHANQRLVPRSALARFAALNGRFMGLAEMTAAYDHLTEVVRTGRTSLPGREASSRTIPSGWISPMAWRP